MNARGFTLIELMIVIILIAIIATMAIPSLLMARLSANEVNAIATVRAVAAAQSQFQKTSRADLDRDGWGEFGTFGEMSGSTGVRQTTQALRPPVLSTAFRFVNSNGEASRAGYLFRVFLPDSTGTGLGEISGGGAPVGIDGTLAENVWCIYAWPNNYGQSGRRVFFMSHGGTITAAESPSYSGSGNGPVAGAGFSGSGAVDSITGTIASGATGRDGLLWISVGN